MRRSRFTIAVVFGVACAPVAVARSQASSSDPAVTVLALERAIEAAQVRGDTAFLRANADSSLRFRHGGAADAQSLAEWLRGVIGSVFYARDVSDQRVEMHGDVAITTGQIKVRRRFHDPALAEYTIWYVRVYRYDHGAWRLLSHQTVRSTLPAG